MNICDQTDGKIGIGADPEQSIANCFCRAASVSEWHTAALRCAGEKFDRLLDLDSIGMELSTLKVFITHK